MRNHLGTSFTVWKRRQTWFWLVRSEHGNGGAIGTAATESEAIREACASIEEMAARRPLLPSLDDRSQGKALVASFSNPHSCDTPFEWVDWWMSIAHQAADKMLTRWANLVQRSS
jgi:hypothetical protein